MNKEDQITFVTNVCEALKQSIIDNIEAGRVPAEWDGHELRKLIALRADQWDYIKMDRSRIRKFNNTVLINNL